MNQNDETGSLHLRNMPQHALDTGAQIAASLGTTRAELFRSSLVSEFTDLINICEKSEPLVAALDNTLAQQLGSTVFQPPVYNYMGVRYHKDMCEILGIKNLDDLRNILMKNTPYLIHRIKQIFSNQDGRSFRLPAGISLWAALYVELAFSSLSVIQEAERRIFCCFQTESSISKYYDDINALRKLNNLHEISSEKLKITKNGNCCSVEIYKPSNYQYGAWRIKLTIKPSTISRTEFEFPHLPQRLFNAESSEPYRTLIVTDNNYSLGFKFVDAVSEFDLYSNGSSEERNKTSLTTVADELIKLIDSYTI
ncbi:MULTISPECIES: hypothetical protein [Providencia]|nr:hypothetical protein [Providencia sp. 23021821]